MFKINKYTTLYYKIIDKARIRIIEGYGENHHIIPVCIGGTNIKSNIIRLTAREHYICHLLLTKMHDNPKLKYGFIMMMANNEYQERTFRITSKMYEIAKKFNSELASKKFKGKQKHNIGKNKWYDPATLKEYFVFDIDVKESWIKGSSPSHISNMNGMHSGNIYYYNPIDNDVIHLPNNMIPPEGYIKGNPNSNTGYTAIGKHSFHCPITGNTIKTFTCPDGYISGSGKQWITNGVDNMLVSLIKHTITNGWYIGKTNVVYHPKVRNTPISTPLGDFNHPITFCEKYSCDISLFDILNGKIRKTEKNKLLIESLNEVKYDFSKTKLENGFKFL